MAKRKAGGKAKGTGATCRPAAGSQSRQHGRCGADAGAVVGGGLPTPNKGNPRLPAADFFSNRDADLEGRIGFQPFLWLLHAMAPRIDLDQADRIWEFATRPFESPRQVAVPSTRHEARNAWCTILADMHRAFVFRSAATAGDADGMIKAGSTTTGSGRLWLAWSLVPNTALECAEGLYNWLAIHDPARALSFREIVLVALRRVQFELREATGQFVEVPNEARENLTEKEQMTLATISERIALVRWDKTCRLAIPYLLNFGKAALPAVEMDRLNDTDKAIAEAIRDTPGIMGKEIAGMVKTSRENVRKRLGKGMPLHAMGFRVPKGRKGYDPPPTP